MTRDTRPDESSERKVNIRLLSLERDLPGGGAELRCSYVMKVQTQNFKAA